MHRAELKKDDGIDIDSPLAELVGRAPSLKRCEMEAVTLPFRRRERQAQEASGETWFMFQATASKTTREAQRPAASAVVVDR